MKKSGNRIDHTPVSTRERQISLNRGPPRRQIVLARFQVTGRGHQPNRVPYKSTTGAQGGALHGARQGKTGALEAESFGAPSSWEKSGVFLAPFGSWDELRQLRRVYEIVSMESL